MESSNNGVDLQVPPEFVLRHFKVPDDGVLHVDVSFTGYNINVTTRHKRRVRRRGSMSSFKLGRPRTFRSSKNGRQIRGS